MPRTRAILPMTLAGAAALFALSACAPEEAAPMPTPSTSASATPSPSAVEPEPTATATADPEAKVTGKSYASIEDFKADVSAATGADCSVFENEGFADGATASGWCMGDIWGLALFAGEKERNAFLDRTEAAYALVGPNWVLTGNVMFTATEYGVAQEQIDGLFWESGDPLPTK